MPTISDEARYYLMFIVFVLSGVQLIEITDWSATSCELLDDYPSEEAMEKWVWCINSTIANYTLKNSHPKTALCCTEDTSSSEVVKTLLSFFIPMILASVELSNAEESIKNKKKVHVLDAAATNKNKALDAAAQDDATAQDL